MTYPKPIMSAKELRSLGFTRRELEAATKVPGQTFAWKTAPGKTGSKWRFDTEGLEAWRKQLARKSA